MSSGQSIACRLSPLSIDLLLKLSRKCQYTPSRIAYVMIEGILPPLDFGELNEISFIAEWLDKLVTLSVYSRRKISRDTFTVWLPNSVIERLDCIAPRVYMSRGRLVQLILECATSVFPVESDFSLMTFFRFVHGFQQCG